MRDAAFEALEGVYAELADELARLGPRCRLSGECCRFAKAGHELFTTPLEFDYLLARADPPGAASEEGVCPFLRDGRCGARDGRMLGCRVYYCDPAFQPHMPGVYEKFHARVKQAMRDHGIPYEYFRFMDRIGAALGITKAGRAEAGRPAGADPARRKRVNPAHPGPVRT